MKQLAALVLCTFVAILMPLYAQQEVEDEIIDSLEVDAQNLFDLDSINTDDSYILAIDSLWLEYQARTQTASDMEGVSTPTNPDLTDSTYIARLAAIPAVIEMPYNGFVRNFIDYYLVRHRDWTEIMLGLGQHFFSLFEQELDAQGLPIELKYLPIVESAMNPNAVSRMGATGLWQLMLATARGYGLDINSLIDERRDPEKSTKVAVRFLKDLYTIYGDWNLVIAAYNCGPGNVNRAIRRAGGKADFWDIYYYLPRETRNYVPRFVAATYAFEYYKEHGICPMANPYPTLCDTVVIDRMIHFEQVAQMVDIPVEQIKRLNPMFRNQIVPGNLKPYTLTLPAASALAVIESLDTIAAHRQNELLVNLRRRVDPAAGRFSSSYTDRALYHQVEKGQTLAQIARKYTVSIENLRNWNNLRSNTIRTGFNLLVFVRDRTQKRANTTNLASLAQPTITTKDGQRIYTVVRGDSLWRIANRFAGVSINDLRKINNFNENTKLDIGMKIIIPTN